MHDASSSGEACFLSSSISTWSLWNIVMFYFSERFLERHVILFQLGDMCGFHSRIDNTLIPTFYFS